MKTRAILKRLNLVGSFMSVNLLVVISVLFVSALAYGADRLVVKDNNGETSFVVTEDGRIGVGTPTPAYAYELNTTGKNAAFVAKRTDGATNFMNATASYAQFGAVTNHPVRLLINSSWRMTINGDSSINMLNGASLTAGGHWTDASSREYKDDIQSLTTGEAMDTLKGLNPVKFAYKRDQSERHVGFVAEEVPDLIATKDRKGLSPMDIVAVLTKVVQVQQKTNEEQQAVIKILGEKLAQLEAKMEELQTGGNPLPVLSRK